MYFGFQGCNDRLPRASTVLDNVNDGHSAAARLSTIIGQNGCGKSSLLKTVSKAVVPQARSGDLSTIKNRVNAYGPKYYWHSTLRTLAQVHTSPPDIDVRTLVSYGRYPYPQAGASG